MGRVWAMPVPSVPCQRLGHQVALEPLRMRPIVLVRRPRLPRKNLVLISGVGPAKRVCLCRHGKKFYCEVNVP